MGYIYLKNVNELHFAGHVVRACSLIKFVTDYKSAPAKVGQVGFLLILNL